MKHVEHHEVVIVGGGTAGISVAARLKRESPGLDVALIEPSRKHYYQPLWTLVGAGLYRPEVSEREQASVIPRGVRWITSAVTDLDPQRNVVETSGGSRIAYQYLVVAMGLQIDWERIRGLKEAMGAPNGVCSVYEYRSLESTWKAIREFKGGTAIFTFPNTPVKCSGAPQKIMYLADHYFRKVGVRKNAKVLFVSAADGLFSVKKYADALSKVISRKSIAATFGHNLVEVNAREKMAVFESTSGGERLSVPYDLLHVTPPMSAPDVVKRSALASHSGWVEVNKRTLQHPRFANVFSLGDVSDLPMQKTAAAIRKQAPVVVANLLALRNGNAMFRTYCGYTSCSIVTDYGKEIHAEFDYENRPKETFPWDQAKERLSMYLFSKHVLPKIYWLGMLKGRI